MRLYLDSRVLIYALDDTEQLGCHTLQRLEGFGDTDWVISDLVRMACLVGPLRRGDQIRLLAFRSFFSDCSMIHHPAAGSGCDSFSCCRALRLRCAAHQ